MELDLRLGDMRDLTLDEPATLIYCPFRALLHLPTWADRRRTFEHVAASLRPDGRFAWNAFAFDPWISTRFVGLHQDKRVPHTMRYAVGDNRIDIRLMTARRARPSRLHHARGAAPQARPVSFEARLSRSAERYFERLADATKTQPQAGKLVV